MHQRAGTIGRASKCARRGLAVLADSTAVSPQSRMPRLLDAVVAISSELSLPDALRAVVEAAVDLVDARYGALGVIGPGEADLKRGLVEFITVGAEQRTIEAIGHYPEGRGILGLLITDPRSRRIADIGSHPASGGFPENHPEMHSFLGVPIRVRDEVFGNLYLTGKRGGPEFTEGDEELVVALAGAAGVAIENVRLHARVQELAVLSDRERIARDLHDTVIQRLFATGMSLQAAVRHLSSAPEVAVRIQQAVDDLDDTIRDIRGAVFALQAHERGQHSLRVAVYALAAEATSSLGFEPRVHLDGPIDAGIAGNVGDELLKTLREALSNIARHAGATVADVRVRAGAEVWLLVTDNGRGLGGNGHRGNGLINMAARAEELHGICTVRNRPEGGVAVEWRVPLARA